MLTAKAGFELDGPIMQEPQFSQLAQQRGGKSRNCHFTLWHGFRKSPSTNPGKGGIFLVHKLPKAFYVVKTPRIENP